MAPTHRHSFCLGPDQKYKNYFYATALAKACGTATGKRKNVMTWLLTKRAIKCIESLAEKTGYPTSTLVIQNPGRNAGIWMHPELEDIFKTWLVEDSGNSTTEQKIQDELCRELNGRKEVSTLVGDIDLLTETEIIEIKSVKNWKAAVGQILVYGQAYPTHKKRIHLFGKTSPSAQRRIHEYCTPLGINVTWHD